MADIAILVAEEYERRVKKSGEEIKLFSCVGVLGQRFSSSWIKEKLQLVKLTPTSQITVAATNGFFSA